MIAEFKIRDTCISKLLISIIWYIQLKYIRNPGVPFTSTVLIPTWISNNVYHKMGDEITYPFPNFNDAAVEFWKWISNFISHLFIIFYNFENHAGSLTLAWANNRPMKHFIFLQLWKTCWIFNSCLSKQQTNETLSFYNFEKHAGSLTLAWANNRPMKHYHFTTLKNMLDL